MGKENADQGCDPKDRLHVRSVVSKSRSADTFSPSIFTSGKARFLNTYLVPKAVRIRFRAPPYLRNSQR
jgi:hypothetical protein